MSFELRWKTKTRKARRPRFPDQFGGGTIEAVETYEVLEWRDTDDRDTPLLWKEVPHVGVDED